VRITANATAHVNKILSTRSLLQNTENNQAAISYELCSQWSRSTVLYT